MRAKVFDWDQGVFAEINFFLKKKKFSILM